ncbi:MAG TPA: peptide chain release factor 3 [Fibrobacteria bacterium]|nr:peptide chain release factor 3 [Fibrobacteria bacterium]HOX52975.1 peptide chain release factor 3 [Fibrobacteria bacterium]
MSLSEIVQKRRTFAIISHPDAGKTTLTEKLLWYGGAIREAGMVRAKRGRKAATSDWMEIERQRGISVTSSVMSFPHDGHHMNLVDTPGHEDFCEDTFRALAAVDSAVVLIDGAKGVEPQTLRLMEVCRMRRTPVITFINKCDRDIRDPLELFDEIEQSLGLPCVPLTLPCGSGVRFRGVYSLVDNAFHSFSERKADDEDRTERGIHRFGLSDPELDRLGGEREAAKLRELAEFVTGAMPGLDRDAYLEGRQTPVFFGSALHLFGVKHLLDALVSIAPAPTRRASDKREVKADEDTFTGFVFKIQANMDPKHRDRMAFVRVCSGKFVRGEKVTHVSSGREIRMAAPTTFVAQDRSLVDEAFSGDIVGIHDPGVFRIGDTLTGGEKLLFEGIPEFSPEHFARVVSKNPLRSKQLAQGLEQLTQEGAAQVFTPFSGPHQLLGVVGRLQFDVIQFRLSGEYGAECVFEPVSVWASRWVVGDEEKVRLFKEQNLFDCAMDRHGGLVYLPSHEFKVRLMQEKWPDLKFESARR